MKLSILSAVAFISSIAVAVPAVSPASILERGDSGCYPYENPDCCINYAVCQCANGWLYQFNEAEGGCQPPWGILTKNGVSGLPGSCC